MLINFTRRILSLAFLCMFGTIMFAQNTGACLVPTVLSGVPDSNQIVFNWQPATANASYTIEYVALPTNSSSSAVSVTSTTNSYTLKNLAKCKEYAFRVKTNCSPTVSSIWSNYKTIKTTGCTPTNCPKPVFALSADSTKIKVSWTSVGTNTYQIEYSTPPASGSTVTPTWIPVTATTSPVTISGLAVCKEYLVRVRTKCSATLFSEWETKSIKTLGCASTNCPKAVFALSADSTKIKVSWTSVGTNTYQIEYSASPVSGTTVTPTWIPVTATTSPVTISGLANCKEYRVRVRTVCSNTLFSEWEYKSIKTLGCASTFCPKPVFALSADSTKIKVSWTSVGTNTYQIEYSTPAAASSVTPTWTPVTATTSPVTITGLTICKEYVVRVRTVCNNTLFSDWEYKSIKTLGCGGTNCPKVALTLNADSTKIKVSWVSVVSNAYQIEYATLSGTTFSAWIPITATTSPVTISGLDICKEYYVRARTDCGNNFFSSWETKSIKTLGCAPTTCPKAIFTLSADSSKIKVSWTSVGTNTYQIEYSTPPASGSTVTSTWTPVTVTTSPVTITGLANCKEYLVRVRTKCSATLFSEWETKSIKTLGCAPTSCPKAIFTLSADSTKIKVSWTSVGTNTYQVEYSTPPASGSTVTPTWTPVTATTSPVTISGLAVCKEYLVRVRTKCSTTLFSDWETKSIKTLGCALTNCPKAVFALSADSSKIKVSWTSVGTNTYQIEYSMPPASGSTVTPTWTPVTVTTSPVTITGLAVCKEYLVRVRTKCSATLFSEWETKSIKTLGCTSTNCPKAVFALSADSTKIKVSWASVGTNTYQVEYSTPPASGSTVTPTWTPVTATTSPVTISGLANCKEYRVRVRTKCSSDFYSEWEIKTIKTLGCSVTSPCSKPSNLTSNPISGGVVLNWLGSAPSYDIRYSKKTAGVVTWTTVNNVNGLTYTISGLESCAFYAWQVRTKCATAQTSDWSNSALFETGGCNNRKAKVMTLSPNPGTYLNIDYSLNKTGKVAFEITNLQGKVVAQIDLGVQQEGVNHYSLNDLQIPAGAYIVTIKLNGARIEVQRWAKTTE